MDRDQLKRLKDLEKENRRLKKLVADLFLDKEVTGCYLTQFALS